MNDNSRLIDSFLQNEMSVAEKLAFENQLLTDRTLLEEFNIQKLIIKASETAGLKNEFAKQIRKKVIARQFIRWGIIVAIVAAGFIFYAIKSNLIFQHKGSEEMLKGFQPVERFDISNAADTIIETKDGVVFAIPAHAFAGSNNIQLEIKTALNAYEIMQNGLSTMSDNDMLQTAGMFCINGFADGKPASLVKKINVSVPAKKINPAMQLFDGVEDSSGSINWVNPKPVEKELRTYDISTLDFYPPKYIPTLKALKKNYLDKKYTDSLYYSFSGYPHSAIPANTSESPTKNDYFVSDSLKPYDRWAVDSTYYPTGGIYQIDPAKIKAIWNQQFNNTIIATKEFEERLRYMHSLCQPDYLEVYLRSLNKPLYKTDQQIADNSSGEIKNKFLEFANRKDGGIMMADGLQEKLSNYFQQKSKAYREAVEKTWTKYQVELERLNNIADEKDREESLRKFTREETVFKEELCINLTEAYNQIGIKRNCNDTVIVPPADKYYNIIISTPGWKNLDVYVFDATKNRQSMEYTDPNTGKTAKLNYKDVYISIKDEEKFDRVLVYLVPDSLSSFQLMQKKGSSFKESLNSLFRYDAVALAYKGNQPFFYRLSGLHPGEYTFSLLPVSEAVIKAELKKYSLNKAEELKTEFEYRLFEQKENMRQIQLLKDTRFREQAAFSIFNCYDGEYWPAKDSASKK